MTTALVHFDFTTGADLDSGYPVTRPTSLASIASCRTRTVLNVASPDAPRYEGVVAARWTSSGHQLTVHYFSGLEPLTRYVIILEASDA